ncbi:MAG: NUDIX hydrolase [Patescibacteria group bacterium]|jgi:ADP-ribose pyrophosphatase
MPPRQLSTEIAHENPWYYVRHDKVEWPNGHEGDYFIVDGEAGCAIIVVQDDKLLTVKQYRYPIGKENIEIPMGRVDGNESLEQTATRELVEETGYQAGHIQKIGVIYPNSGFCNNVIHIFVASDLSSSEQALGKEEHGLTFEWIPLDEWKRLIGQNMIIDADTLAAWALYCNQPLKS